MSDSKTSGDDGGNQNIKRNLPSWMSSRENEDAKSSRAKGRGKAHNGSSSKEPGGFSRLMEGVVFVLSGFVNPERSTLRSQALEMGAEYQPDWNAECTLLVCAFPNTPKFRQVESDRGTIVSKEWILECYKQKKLVDIDSYLMHAGKPWRRSKISNESSQDQKASAPRKSNKQADKGSHSEPTTSTSIKNRDSNPAKECFSPSKLNKWAIDDLNGTISWLESQEEKPEPSEIKKIAAEGILTCLQDAIDLLEQKQDVRQVTEQWSFIPRVVAELAKLDTSDKDSASVPKDDLCRQAKACKRIYEAELSNKDNDSTKKKKRLTTGESGRGKNGRATVGSSSAAGYDSDETIEMTEEEIDLAYKTITSELCK